MTHTELRPRPGVTSRRPGGPVVAWLPAYKRRWPPRSERGLTVWAVLVPEALTYASIAGVSLVVGLYAARPALIHYAVFGSSRHGRHCVASGGEFGDAIWPGSAKCKSC